MKRAWGRDSSIRAAVLALAFFGLFAVDAFAGNPVSKFTDRDGVPLRQYLRVVLNYGIADRSTCEIENSADRTRMYCAQWFSRYCKPATATCKKFEQEVNLRIESD